MAKNIQSLQLLRNTSQLYATREAALTALTGGTILAGTQDGTPVLARYKGTDNKIYTLVGYYAAASGITGGDSATSHMTVFDFEGSAADVDKLRQEINAKLGDGVTSTNTATAQFAALSGTPNDTSATTSVAGAKAYTDDKVTEVVNGLDGTITADTGYYISKVDEVNGKISGTTAALPTVAAISGAGKPITAVSENLGVVSATAGTINAEYVNVTGSVFSSTTVQAALEEIETEYKAADAAIVGDATDSGDTLGKLEDRIDELETDAKEYHIVKTTTDLPETIKESYSLVDAAGNVSGDTIDIPKDSHIVSITYNGTTQKLTYTYIDASGNTQSTDVDMSELILETEFASGVTVTNHIAHGVVDPTSEKDGNNNSFLTVGADGFKVNGIKDEIDAKIAALDASVSGGTTAGTATSNHVQVVVDEVDGKLTAVTVSETNIADADDLAALSSKTVTEIASSNDSITVASGATTAADGTVKYDIITDASKIQMSGFTAAESGFTAIAESSSVTEAFKAVETYVLENEQVVSAALNDLETTKAEKTALDAEIAARKAVDGQNGDTYVANAGAKYISGATSLNDADLKLDAAIANITTSFIEGVQVNGKDLPENNNKVNVQIEASDTSGEDGNKAIVITQDATSGKLTLALGTIDAGTY